MLRTLGDIYNYTNDRLLSGELSSIYDILEYLNECQDVICQRDPLEAPILYVDLTTNAITKPSDYMELSKIVIDDEEVQPMEIWGNLITLPSQYTSGEAKLYYFKKPTTLDPNNLSQIPDLDQRYFTTMAKFAAEMHYLTDDDDDMSSAFKNSFFESLTIFNKRKQNKQSYYKNLW